MATRKPSKKQLQADFTRLFNKHFNGIQVDIMDLGKIAREQEAAYQYAIGMGMTHEGALHHVEMGTRDAVPRYRKNPGRPIKAGYSAACDACGSVHHDKDQMLCKPCREWNGKPTLQEFRKSFPYSVKLSSSEWGAVKYAEARGYTWAEGLYNADAVEEHENGTKVCRFSESTIWQFAESLRGEGFVFPLAGAALRDKILALLNKVV